MINGKLSSLVEDLSFTGPTGSGSFSIQNAEQPDTVFVGRPWALDVGFSPLFSLGWKASVASKHPLMIALKAIGLDSGPYVAINGSASATVSGLSRDVYGTLHAASANAVTGNLSIKAGAELSTEQSETFRLDLNAQTSATLSGAFTVNPDTPSVYLDGCELTLGGLTVNAMCQVFVELFGRWEEEMSIQKSWTLLEGSTSSLGRITLL